MHFFLELSVNVKTEICSGLHSELHKLKGSAILKVEISSFMLIRIKINIKIMFVPKLM